MSHVDSQPVSFVLPRHIGVRRIAIIVSMSLSAVQLIAAISIFLSSRRSRALGLIGSIIAVMGGSSLPVGVYGLWYLTVGAGSDELTRSHA